MDVGLHIASIGTVVVLNKTRTRYRHKLLSIIDKIDLQLILRC